MLTVNLRTLLLGVGFFFSATASGAELQAQQVGDCVAWYSPQLRAPPETCLDVVNMHPGLDLATFLSLNPTIHPYCDNMLAGHAVCIRALRPNDCPKPSEPTPQSPKISPKQPQSSATPTPQESGSTASNGWH